MTPSRVLAALALVGLSASLDPTSDAAELNPLNDVQTRIATLSLGEAGDVSSAAGDAPSFCVVTRVYMPETPYLQSFLRHYTALGVKKFYAFNNFWEQHEELLEVVRNFTLPSEVSLDLISIANQSDADALINSLGIEFIKEDWVIGVDVDEFWVLPDGVANLRQLVETRPADHYQMPWVIVPNGAIQGYRRAPYAGLPGHAGKWMARRSAMKGLTYKTMHEPYMIPDVEWLRLGSTVVGRRWSQHDAADVGNLVHFWGRSFQDMLLKQIVQRGMNRHSSWVTGALSGAMGTLPTRILTLAFFELQRGPMVHIDPGHDLLEPDVELERRLIEQAMGHLEDTSSTVEKSLDDKLETLHAAYEANRQYMSETFDGLLGEKAAKPITDEMQELCAHKNSVDTKSDCPHYPEWTVARMGGWLTYHLPRQPWWDDAVANTFSGSTGEGAKNTSARAPSPAPQRRSARARRHVSGAEANSTLAAEGAATPRRDGAFLRRRAER